MAMCRASLLLAVLSVPVCAQAVISTHAGVLDYFEGAVAIDGRAVTASNGRYPQLAAGSIVSTAQGRAEVLLGPDVFLWLGHRGGVRMRRTGLEDTEVELLSGSVVVRAARLPVGTAVTLIRGAVRLRFTGPGLFRFDSMPCKIRVVGGEATLSRASGTLAVSAQQQVIPCSGAIASVRAEGTPDGLDRWARQRSEAIRSFNAATGGHNNRKPRRRSLPYPAAISPFPRRTW